MSHPSIRPWVGALTVLGLLLVNQSALPLTTAAQQTIPGAPTQALLQGVVVFESTGQAVESATVRLVGTDIETQTGRYGGFAFPDVEPGVFSVRVSAVGHPSVVQEVEVGGDGIVFIQFRLPSIAAVLSELLVGAQREGQAEIELTAADLLVAEVPSTRINTGIIGRTDYQIQLRNSGSSFSENTEPLIFIDDVLMSRLGQALQTLSQIPASDVEHIEVLKGPAAAFRYPMAANGVVLVTTRSGSGR